MDVGLNSEQLALRDTVRGILRAECPPDAARQAFEDSEADPERWRTLWKTVVGLGWTELAAHDAAGEFGPVELTVVLEECGAAITPVPLLSSVGLAAGVLRAAGPGVDGVLTEIASGVVATLAVHSPGARLPGAPMTLRDGQLRGRAQAVPHAARAELIVTLATSDDGLVAAVARSGDGVTVAASESTDPAQPVADVEIDAAPVAVAPVESVETALAAPLVAAAADLVGVASAALARSVDHAKTRRQFGSPIGAFQGVKHALADNYVSVERARSLTYAAAARLDNPAPPGPQPLWPKRRPPMPRARARAPWSRCTARWGRPGSTTRTSIVRHAWQGAALLGDSRALYYELGRRFAGGAK